jgi:hypothetical protein
MKRTLFTLLICVTSLVCTAADDGNGSHEQQVEKKKQLIFVWPGKTPTTYDPYYSEQKEITVKITKQKQ